jgi:hypothetical protein
MELVESVILYDKQKCLFNCPFTLIYNNHEEVVNFYFSPGDYKGQDEMLLARINYCSKVLFSHFMKTFEGLQEICLDDSIDASDESVDKINNNLSILYNLFIFFKKIHSDSSVSSRLSELYDELLEMFLLLEDYYTVEKKKGLYVWKNRFIGLEKM